MFYRLLRRSRRASRSARFTERIRKSTQVDVEGTWRAFSSCFAPTTTLSVNVADDTEAIRLDPNYADAYAGRCYSRALTGKELNIALANHNEALRLQPDGVSAHVSLGFIHFKLGAHDAAIAEYTAALAKQPHISTALYKRGEAKLRMGDTIGGQADIRAAASIDITVFSTASDAPT